MNEFSHLKYAELRKLAKKAGIKANLKHEKLVAELTKFYEKEAESKKVESRKSSSNDKIKVTPKSEAVITRPKTPVPKSRTPLAARCLSPAPKLHSPAGGKPATPKQQTPGSTKPAHRWEKRVFSPSVAARSVTPPSKLSTPKNKLSGPNSTSVKPSPLVRIGEKRKQTETPESVQPEKKSKLENTPTSHSRTVTPNNTKKSRSTFEKVPTPDLSSPLVDSNKKKRRSTFEKAPTPNLKTPEIESPQRRRSGRHSAGSSQSVVEMLGAMKTDMDSEEMKKSLMSVLDRNVKDKVKAVPVSSTGIPRFAAFAMKNKYSKPVTPGNKDWGKIHKKNFEKFDSIDVYLQKKRKRAEDITASVKKAKALLSEVHTAVNKLKSHKTPDTNENKFVKPRVSNANKTTPFKPTILQTSKMNLNFGAKVSPKTLPRKSPKSVISSALKSTQQVSRKSTGSLATKKKTETPFKFTAVNTSTLNNTVASTKKSVFDLKASLARPITWKTHKGKLKPIEDSTQSPKYIKTQSTTKTKTKPDRSTRRAKVVERRADKKHDAQMARRGIKI